MKIDGPEGAAREAREPEPRAREQALREKLESDGRAERFAGFYCSPTLSQRKLQQDEVLEELKQQIGSLEQSAAQIEKRTAGVGAEIEGIENAIEEIKSQMGTRIPSARG